MANKKLYRSDDRMLGGVMAGFAEYTDSDPTLWRLLGATIIVLSGIFPGLLLYIVAWLIMPDKSHGASSGKEVPSRSKL